MQSILNLSRLFYKFASSYDEIKQKIEQEAKKNPKPFSYLFSSSDRIYLPFKKNDKINLSEEDEKVIRVLQQYEFKDIDYVSGYTTSPSGRIFKINTALSSIENKLIKQEQNEEKKEKISNFFSLLSKTFMNSNARVASKHKQLDVVISQDPFDVANMSTDRGWTSCMNLKKKQTGNVSAEDNILCEVASGGLVAYLIEPNDKEIKNPIARIWIRRFINSDGESYAVPEDQTYPTGFVDFYDFVNNWLKEKQVPIAGELELSGAEHSDSFPHKKVYKAPDFISQEKYESLDEKYKFRPEILIAILNNAESYSNSFILNNILPAFVLNKDNLVMHSEDYSKWVLIALEKKLPIEKIFTVKLLDELKSKNDKYSKILYEKIINSNMISDQYYEALKRNVKKKQENIKNYNKNEVDFYILAESTYNALKTCSPQQFDEIIYVVEFVKTLPNILAEDYDKFVLKILEIITDRQMFNLKLLSMLKSDLVRIFDNIKDYRSNACKIFIDALEAGKSKFTFMKQNIINKIKFFERSQAHMSNVAAEKLKEIIVYF